MREHKKKFKVLAKGVQRAAKECAKIEQAVAAEAQERRQALEDKRSARAERRAELEAEEREDKKVASPHILPVRLTLFVGACQGTLHL